MTKWHFVVTATGWDDRTGRPSGFQAAAKIVDDEKAAAGVEIPGGFGEGRTIGSAVRASLRNLDATLGGRDR